MPHMKWSFEDTANSAFRKVSPTLESTLHLPRIICLHGGGTNARIFRAQCRMLRSHLAPHFRLVFPDAPFFSQPGPDVVSVYKEWGPFRSWLRPANSGPSSLRDANEVVTESIDACVAKAMREDGQAGATGPWVGLLGFSQGAKIAATMLLRQQNQNETSAWGIPQGETDYHFAVLLAGRAPVLSMNSDKREPTKASPGILRLPTIHVHGLQDENISLHRDLLQCCDKSSVRLVEWDGKHRVPIKTKDVSAVVAEVMDLTRELGILQSY